jgi:hypothetical protein
MIKEHKNCYSCGWSKYERINRPDGSWFQYYCYHQKKVTPELIEDQYQNTCRLWERRDVEELITQTLKNMEWIMDFCIAKLSQKPYKQDSTPMPWVHGGDDSTFDYIPNGIDTMLWIIKAFGTVFNYEDEYEDVFRVCLPPQQDCSPGGSFRDKFLKLATLLGYTKDELINDAGYYEFEADEETELLDWDIIKYRIKEATIDCMDDGVPFKSIYVGSILNLTPSGKYYTPWANSNVTEREADIDRAWWERLEQEAEKHGLFIFCGEGDPTDIFVGMVVEKEGDPDHLPDECIKCEEV